MLPLAPDASQAGCQGKARSQERIERERQRERVYESAMSLMAHDEKGGGRERERQTEQRTGKERE